MNKMMTAKELQLMSVAERLRLIEAVWATLCETPDQLPTPEWHRAELDARLDAHKRDPEAAKPWSETRRDILLAPRK